MKLLVLGGTLFLGRHVVEAALDRGHEVTLFNRGQTNPGLFPEVEKLQGDRNRRLEALEGRRWDAVIDPSGYVPRLVRMSAELLKDAVEHYAFVSTIGVYADFKQQGIDEEAPTQELDDPATEEVTGDSYGGLKVLCERAVEEVMPGRALIVRAGLLVGPHDPTDRFTYWPRRVARGGEVLAPGRPDQQVQFIHARDAADWMVRMAEERKGGTYNVTGPAERLTMGEVLETCREVTGSDARLTWVSEEFLLANEVTPWSELPLWLPPHWAGMQGTNVSRVLEAGLTFRPLAETIRDTLAWDAARPGAEETGARLASGAGTRAGLDPDREAELLRKWHDRTAMA
ncbi:MAG TPA: SDR family oxidoreductase [Ardenticatenaceae bacterium]|nr:SDR family oxidoreductase [Ardenticatenaceae bacterium]